MLTIKFEEKTEDEARSLIYQICKSIGGWEEYDNDVFVRNPYLEGDKWIVKLSIFSSEEVGYEMEVRALPTFVKTEDVAKHCGSYSLQ